MGSGFSASLALVAFPASNLQGMGNLPVGQQTRWGSSRAALCCHSPCSTGILAENFLSSCSSEPWLSSRQAGP